jgi:hypothetical protein
MYYIGGNETTFCVHSANASKPFIIDIDGTIIEYDDEGSINVPGDVEYDLHKDDGSHVHFFLLFQLTKDMITDINGIDEGPKSGNIPTTGARNFLAPFLII